MFERFTNDARQVVVLAQDEARMLEHPAIGTEHVLLGMVREHEGVAARVLADIGIELESLRAQVVRASSVGLVFEKRASERASCTITAPIPRRSRTWRVAYTVTRERNTP